MQGSLFNYMLRSKYMLMDESKFNKLNESNTYKGYL